MNRDEAEVMAEMFARFLMDQLPANEWRDFAHGASIRIMKLSGEKTSKSGSYKLQAAASPFADTLVPKKP
jgi:hypothetical protein